MGLGWPAANKRTFDFDLFDVEQVGHIAFFGLALINIMFYMTVDGLALAGGSIEVASILFVVGAATMPTCCFLLGAPKTPKPLIVFLCGVKNEIK